MKHKHYGIELDTDEPTTGVYSIHDTQYLEEDGHIDVDWETFTESADWEAMTEDQQDDAGMFWESSTLLVGSWKNVNGQYIPDTSGEYAAIVNVNSNTVQVVHSARILYGIMCSPCYPGQVDAEIDDPATPDAEHKQAYFALPLELLRTD